MSAAGLTGLDFAVVAACVAAVVAIGFIGGRGSGTTEDYMLGGRSMPVWAAVLSFLATEISAMTIIGVPATGYRENWQYMQFFIGSTAARFTVAALFIPAFYAYKCTTVYEYLYHRFGPKTQYAATLLFFVTRLLASGVRLMAACVAISVLLGVGLKPVIAAFTVVGIAYIGFGGVRAVVWTNVFQAGVFMGAGVVTLLYLWWRVDGGLPEACRVASAAGKLSLFNWGPPAGEPGFWAKFFSDPNILWVAILNGYFGSMAAFGTDHEMTQRVLTLSSRKESQRTMILSAVGGLLALLVFLPIGTGLFVFYSQHPEMALPQALDKIYPHFASQIMPSPLKGLVLAAIVMASIDSPLASLSAAFVNDLYRPLLAPGRPDKHYLWVSRVCVGVFGLLLAAIAYGFSFYDKMLWLAFKIGGVTYGSLLGAFLYGLLTKAKGSDGGNVAAMAAMVGVNAWLLVLTEHKVLALGWSWLILIGTAGTFALAAALGRLFPPPHRA